MIASTEQIETAPASTQAEPKATKTARVGKKRANVAPKRAKSEKKASPAKKAPKTRPSQKKGASARDGSKAARILELPKRPGGATSKELMKATGNGCGPAEPSYLKKRTRGHTETTAFNRSAHRRSRRRCGRDKGS